jgi:hypothetical protein
MFPSGPWRGFWEQNVLDRYPVREMTLRFDQGQLEGEGQDCVGRFVIDGNYTDQGEVSFIKEYVGSHSLLYEGRVDALGLIIGEWTGDLGWPTNRFVLWPVAGPKGRWNDTETGDDAGAAGVFDPGVLVAGWIAHAERGPKGKQYFWAWNGLYDLVHKDPEHAWPVIRKLVADAPSDRVLANVAAGPLQDLLVYHQWAFIDRLLAAAKSDARFRRCLWGSRGGSSRLDEEVRARVDQAVRGVPPW